MQFRESTINSTKLIVPVTPPAPLLKVNFCQVLVDVKRARYYMSFAEDSRVKHVDFVNTS
jgi:hypothetical protein